MALPRLNFTLLEVFYDLIFFQAQAPGGNGHPHNIFAIAIPILINIVALKYLHHHQSPFTTHPKTAFSGVLVMLFHFFALDYHHRLGMHINRPLALDGFIHRCSRFLGYMAMAILTSLIFPDSASPVVYAVYTALSVDGIVVLVCRKMGGWLVRLVAEQGNILPL